MPPSLRHDILNISFDNNDAFINNTLAVYLLSVCSLYYVGKP